MLENCIDKILTLFLQSLRCIGCERITVCKPSCDQVYVEHTRNVTEVIFFKLVALERRLDTNSRAPRGIQKLIKKKRKRDIQDNYSVIGNATGSLRWISEEKS